ncbi:MAG: hypothetical protein IAF02_23915 [Anaerolineae bacterium]|nr:hypothetical protein [Anaerolineae bacterium]
MKKTAKTELWQLQTSLQALVRVLEQEPSHLDGRTCQILARSLAEILQEVETFPPKISEEKIETFAKDVLVSTGDLQQELANHWFEELKPKMERAVERAAALEHELDEFACLSLNGEAWGAVCVKCLRWVYVGSDTVSGALLEKCTGWYASWK